MDHAWLLHPRQARTQPRPRPPAPLVVPPLVVSSSWIARIMEKITDERYDHDGDPFPSTVHCLSDGPRPMLARWRARSATPTRSNVHVSVPPHCTRTVFRLHGSQEMVQFGHPRAKSQPDMYTPALQQGRGASEETAGAERANCPLDVPERHHVDVSSCLSEKNPPRPSQASRCT